MTNVSPLRKFTRIPGMVALAVVAAASPLLVSRCKSQKTPASQSPGEPLKIEGAKIHPTVFVTPPDIARTRENIRRFDWANQTADAVLREADAWLAKSDSWLRSVVTAPGAAFAYGIVACPICGANWGPFAREGATLALTHL